MSYFLFGPNADSWAIGNRSWNAYQNLPTSFSKFFEDQTLTANTVQWFSTGPGGLCCFLQSNGAFIQSQNPNLVSDTSPSNLYGMTIQQVDHLSFSPEGGWFVRYNDGTVRLSMTGSFHENFHTAANGFMQTRGSAGYSRQRSRIKWAFFGADGAIILVLDTGEHRWIGISVDLVTVIRTQIGLGFSLTKRSTLCHWDKSYYYLNWTKSYGLETWASWNIKPNGILTPLLLREVGEGRIPVSHTVQAPQVTLSPASNPVPTLAGGKVAGYALYSRQSTSDGSITFLKGEQITNIKQQNSDWPTGTNEKGQSGFFPRNWVTIWGDFTSGSINCDGCGQTIDGAFFHCSICRGGDFDLCYVCGEKPPWKTKKCHDGNHQVTLKMQTSNAQGQLAIMTCSDKDWKKTVESNTWESIKPLDNSEQDLGLSRLNISPPALPSRPSSARPSSSGPSTLKPSSSGPSIIRPSSSGPSTNSHTSNYSTSNPFLSNPLLNNYATGNPLINNPATSKPEKKDNDYEEELSSSLDSNIITESPNVLWDDVAGLEQAKEELNEAVILPIRYPQLFTGKRKARKGILLFGPPGTGKSYLAKACATEIKCTFFSISCSSIMSKWIGESEKLVRALFQKARKSKPSIIFIDEIDAMGGTREESTPGDKYLTGMKTEFLVQMDGVGNDSTGVLVLAATNLPWKLDPALRRRFQRRIHIGLPDAKARTRMFENGFEDMQTDLKSADYKNIGEITKGFSGSDIASVVQDALMIPVKKITSATHFKKVMRDHQIRFTPCKPYDHGAIPMRLAQVPPDQLVEPPLSADDLYAAVKKARPSVAVGELGKYTKWTEEFGSEGA